MQLLLLDNGFVQLLLLRRSGLLWADLGCRRCSRCGWRSRPSRRVDETTANMGPTDALVVEATISVRDRVALQHNIITRNLLEKVQHYHKQ